MWGMGGLEFIMLHLEKYIDKNLISTSDFLRGQWVNAWGYVLRTLTNCFGYIFVHALAVNFLKKLPQFVALPIFQNSYLSFG